MPRCAAARQSVPGHGGGRAARADPPWRNPRPLAHPYPHHRPTPTPRGTKAGRARARARRTAILTMSGLSSRRRSRRADPRGP